MLGTPQVGPTSTPKEMVEHGNTITAEYLKNAAL